MPNLVVERGNDKGACLEIGCEDRTYVIGRSSECDLTVGDRFCSRQHFEINCESGWFFLRDLESHNGTRRNGKRLGGRVELASGTGLIRWLGGRISADGSAAATRLGAEETGERPADGLGGAEGRLSIIGTRRRLGQRRADYPEVEAELPRRASRNLRLSASSASVQSSRRAPWRRSTWYRKRSWSSDCGSSRY